MNRHIVGIVHEKIYCGGIRCRFAESGISFNYTIFNVQVTGVMNISEVEHSMLAVYLAFHYKKPYRINHCIPFTADC